MYLLPQHWGLMHGQQHIALQKEGISAFSKTLAVEYGMKGLNINCVCPASIETPMSSNPSDAKRY